MIHETVPTSLAWDLLRFGYREPPKVEIFDTPTDSHYRQSTWTRDAPHQQLNISAQCSLQLHRRRQPQPAVLMSPSPGLGLSTPEGLWLARQLLRPQLPHDIHDHILEGVCKAIDGTHVLSVLPTGGGKSGYFYCFILLLWALCKLSPPCSLLKRKYPVNPVLIAVFPTKGLEEEMV